MPIVESQHLLPRLRWKLSVLSVMLWRRAIARSIPKRATATRLGWAWAPAIKQSEIPRDQLFITTKLANKDQGYESTLEDSRRKLDLEYIDLYLIHWPGKDMFKESL